MPVYAYHCRACGNDFDFKQSFSDDPLTVCKVCDVEGQVHRVIQPAGVVFKGSGFYVTDTRGATKPDPTPGKKDEAAATTKSESSDNSSSNGAATSEKPAATSASTSSTASTTSGAAD